MTEPAPKKVLFVDDEPLVLSGLRRLLHPISATWKPSFANGGEAALDELSREHYDVMVTDMRMPGMDGLVLMKEALQRFPGVVRIALSGHLDQATALRATTIAHQFIAKPCTREELTSVLDRAHRVHQLVSNPALRDIIGGVVTLPARPAVYSGLTEALVDPEVSVDAVARMIERDIAISGKVLHIVNSAFLVSVQRITTVRAAVARVGLSRIRFLVLSAEVFRGWNGQIPGWSIDEIFEQSMRTADLAMHMVRGDEAREDAFLSGMLHDIGQLVLASYAPSYFEEVISTARRQHEPLWKVEQQARGVTHAELGAYLLGLWGLPYSIMEAVAYHHPVEQHRGHGIDVASAVLLATRLVEESLGSDSPPIDDEVLATLGVDPARFDLCAWRARAASAPTF